MPHIHPRTAFWLIVLLLLVISALLGALTWWLGHQADSPGAVVPRRGDPYGAGVQPAEAHRGYEGGNMKKVAIVTDSSANVPAEVARQWDIQVVPALLVYRGKSFRDGVDITPGELYRWLRANKYLATTSAPSIGDFVRVYSALAGKASAIVSIHPSPQLTSIYNVAVAASQMIENVPIRVVNCRAAAMAHGFVVLEAARTTAAGASMDEVVARAEAVAAKVRLFAAIDNMEYLYRSGRIGAAASLMATMLQIKPIVYLIGGRVEAWARPRSTRRAMQMMLRELARQVDGRRAHVAVMHADAPAEAEELRQHIAGQIEPAELFVTEFTPVMGAHTGPGLVGLAFYAEPDTDQGQTAGNKQ